MDMEENKMSLSLNREGSDGLIEWSESIASTKFFNRCWDPAINALHIKLFQENGGFTFAEVQEVLNELEQIKNWAKAHLDVKDAETLVEKATYLQETIPNAFVDHEKSTIYIY